MSNVFVLPVRVYYEDTDHGGVVYYANYLKFMERSRTDFLRAQGLEQDALIINHDLIFAVKRVEADYIHPAVFNDLLYVTAQVIEKSRVKIVFKQQIFKAFANESRETKVKSNDQKQSSMDPYFDNIAKITNNSILLCEAVVTIVALSAEKMRPKRISENIFKELMCEH